MLMKNHSKRGLKKRMKHNICPPHRRQDEHHTANVAEAIEQAIKRDSSFQSLKQV